MIRTAAGDGAQEKLKTSPFFKSLYTPQEKPSKSSPDLPLGRIAIEDFSYTRVLERLLMYERRIENSLYKTTLELQRLTLVKKLKENPNPENPFNHVGYNQPA